MKQPNRELNSAEHRATHFRLSIVVQQAQRSFPVEKNRRKFRTRINRWPANSITPPENGSLALCCEIQFMIVCVPVSFFFLGEGDRLQISCMPGFVILFLSSYEVVETIAMGGADFATHIEKTLTGRDKSQDTPYLNQQY